LSLTFQNIDKSTFHNNKYFIKINI